MTAEHDLRKLKQRLVASKHRIAVAIAADIAEEIEACLADLHSSDALVELTVPRDEQSLTAWLHHKPERLFSATTALALASHAYRRANELLKPDENEILAVGGTHFSSTPNTPAPVSCFLATQSANRTRLFTFIHTGAFENSTRALDVARWILGVLAQATGVTDPDVARPLPGELVSCEEESAEPLLAEVYAGKSGIVWSTSPSKLQSVALQQECGLLSGAFDPLHEGHGALQKAAQHRLRRPVVYELSIRNVDKPPLDFLSIAQRRRQFPTIPLALTNAPTFRDKSRLVPKCTFVIGVDTAFRVVQPAYYNGCETSMRDSLEAIQAAGCHFLVAGRKMRGQFLTLDDVPIPHDFSHLFDELPNSEFRVDVSSTEHRQDR